MSTALVRLPNPNPNLVEENSLPVIVANTQGLLEVLEGFEKDLAKVLPENEKPERWALVIRNAFAKNPGLLGSTRQSILQSLRQAAELGLEPSGTLGAGYLVPYNNKKKIPTTKGGVIEVKVLECTFQPGYRGFTTLMVSNGSASKVDGRAVYDCDEFEVEYGLNEQLRHVPKVERPEDAKLIGAYAVVTLPSGEKKFLFMDREQIERRRRASRAPDSLMWKTYPEEGYKKTVLRAVAKTMDLRPNEKLRRALELDDQHYDLEALEHAERKKAKEKRVELRKDAVENPSESVAAEPEPEPENVQDAEYTEGEPKPAPAPKKEAPPPSEEDAELAARQKGCKAVIELAAQLDKLGVDPIKEFQQLDFLEDCSVEDLRTLYSRLKVRLAKAQKEAPDGEHAH